MQIKVRKSITKYVEIKLPYFTRVGDHHYMIFGEKERDSICVFDSEDYPSIDYAFIDHALDPNFKESSREKFSSVYNRAQNHFNNLINNNKKDEKKR